MQDYTFEFGLTLEKAESRDGRMFVQGVASTTSVDQQNDAFSPNALKSMAAGAIGKPLVTSHNHEFSDEIGMIQRAEVRGNQLFIEGELDRDDVMAQRLFKKIQKSKTGVGFSVGASLISVKPGLNKSHRILDDVRLNHVALTSKPVNKDTFCVAINKALTNYPDDIAKADVSDEQREAHATYTENNSHPACSANAAKSEELHNMSKTETLEKAGAKFSDDTLNQLKGIHAMASPEVKGAIQAMCAPEVDDTFWSPQEVEDAPEGASQASAPNEPSGDDAQAVAEAKEPNDDGSGEGKYVGVVDKAMIEKAVQDALAPQLADLDKKRADLDAAIAVFKSETEKLQISKAGPSVVPKPSTLELRKSHRNDTDLLAHMLLNATQGG